MTEVPFRSRRIVVACGLVVAFILVIVRLVNLQVLQAAELTVKADRQHQKNVTLEGARGTIYDRNSKVLAMNMDVPSVFGVPTSLGNPGLTARNLSPILHVKATEMRRSSNRKNILCGWRESWNPSKDDGSNGCLSTVSGL